MHFGAAALADAGHLERRDRLSAAKLHLVHVAVAPDRQAQPLRERIHHRHADAVQPAGDLVAVRIELAAGVQLRHDDLGGRALRLVVSLDAGRDAAPVIEDGDGIVGMHGDRDLVAEPGERLVDRVVHHLEHHVVQARAIGSVSDVHAGALADRLEAFEDLDRVRAVVVGIGRQTRSSSA